MMYAFLGRVYVISKLLVSDVSQWDFMVYWLGL